MARRQLEISHLSDEVFQLCQQTPMDLSGSATTTPLLHAADMDIEILSIRIVYSEASSADSGVAVHLGKESDADYFANETSEVSKSQWYEKDVSPLNPILEAGDTLLASHAGGKTGTGEVFFAVEYRYVPSN